ncbi:MAG TPA: hypothetical protein VL200_03510 [Lacunisphaera sp.]|jgi:hypothetical protein|nr:hypothetical protein [Lacunisphaera sp.]
MNSADFEHAPLGRIVHGLSQTDSQTTAEIKASLQDKGYDPDALAVRLKARAAQLSRESRLGWMQQGEVFQACAAAAQIGQSWLKRTKEEVEAAFQAVQSGRYGPEGQLRVQSAFSNLTNITWESKAAFLDEVDVLLALKKLPPELPPK